MTFRIVGGEARLRKAGSADERASRGAGVVTRLRGVVASNALTTDEIMALTRGKP